MIAVGLFVFPAVLVLVWSNALVRYAIAGHQYDKPGWPALAFSVLLYLVATGIAYKCGQKRMAIAALVGLAIPLMVFGACFNLIP